MAYYKSLKAALSNPSDVTGLRVTISKLEMPEEVFQFENLKELLLIGKKIEELPPLFSHLQNLENISLNLDKLKVVPREIFELPNLSILKVKGAKLEKLDIPIGKFNLRRLALNNCGLEALPDSITSLTQLEELSISGNKITSLPETIGLLSELSRVNLENNNMTELPESFFTLKKIKHLCLDGNKFPDDHKKKIAEIFNFWF
jgi:Leucine-rich repeat (LRR) protein